MKTGLPRDPRIGRLARRLGCSRLEAIGLVEMLFHFAMDHADDGGVGRFNSEELADGLLWDGDHEILENALIESGWLCPCDEFRLVICDWHSHAPDFIHRRINRTGRAFATGATPKSARGSGDIGRPLGDQGAPQGKARQAKPSQAKPSQGEEEPPAPASVGPSVMTFPIKDGKEWKLPPELYQTLKADFAPRGVDVDLELIKARNHVLIDPKCRKTARGMVKYLTDWMPRSIEFAKRNSNGSSKTTAQRQREELIEDRPRTRDELMDGYN